VEIAIRSGLSVRMLTMVKQNYGRDTSNVHAMPEGSNNVFAIRRRWNDL